MIFFLLFVFNQFFVFLYSITDLIFARSLIVN